MVEKRGTRLTYNLELLGILADYLTRYPDMRFHQALQNLGINKREQGDRFYEESKETYEYVQTLAEHHL